jgi:general secretion pathway protein K
VTHDEQGNPESASCSSSSDGLSALFLPAQQGGNTMAHLTSTAPAHRQRGIALVVALWLVMLLTIIGSSHARNVRIETRLAHNQLGIAKARALAEAGINRAIMELFVSNVSERWSFDGTVNEFELDSGRIRASIRSATGLIDLNTVESVLLENVLTQLGVKDGTRQKLTDAVLDWRDKDNLRHLHGAEDRDYRHAGLEWGARDGPFAAVDELRYVLGMTNEVFVQLAPYLTVFSGHSGVDLKYAPPWLLTVLGGTDEEPGEVDAGNDLSPTSVYHINAWATSAGGSQASMEVVIGVSPASEVPYMILSWREPARMGIKSPG